jgi:hypothetical protein
MTCNIQCLNGRCHRRDDVRLDTPSAGSAVVARRVAPGPLGNAPQDLCN